MSQSADKEIHILIGGDGTLTMIHDDAFVALHDEGDVSIERASHVEPDSCGEWLADLSPVGGPCLGPFPLRGTALDAERDWLNAHVL